MRKMKRMNRKVVDVFVMDEEELIEYFERVIAKYFYQ
jgi:hypothetical protein